MDRLLRLGLLALALVVAGSCRTRDLPPEATRAQPNFLVIVADDLGSSDIGPFGGEIETPNLDALAETGLVATEFYVAPDGGPTNAMLLTGVDHHIAGIGDVRRWRQDPLGENRYEERLSDRVVTLPALLRNAGYHTYMAGRWELGQEPENRPFARGFERSFALHDGAASYWSDMVSAIPGRKQAFYTQDGQPVEELPEDYYSTEFFTDFLLERIDENLADGRPFFAYLTYQAPHGPLSVPEGWRDRYEGRYDDGYDKIRDARILRQKLDGLVHEYVKPYPGLPTIPPWKALSDNGKKVQARKMELYAAMVTNMDHHIGRILDYLREEDELRNTVVVFMSDNGAEPGDRGAFGMDPRHREFYVEQFPVTDPEQWGGPGTFLEVGAAWAQVSSAPFRLFKGTMAEGGIRSPLIVSGPGVKSTVGLLGVRRRKATEEVLCVLDVAPTFLELAGVEHPKAWRGRRVAPLQGMSWVSLLANEFEFKLVKRRRALGFELGGSRAMRHGYWKAVRMPKPFGSGEWRLYRLKFDPAELYDRSKDKPEKLKALVELWNEHASENGIAIDAPKKPAPSPSPDAVPPAAEGGAPVAQKPTPSEM